MPDLIKVEIFGIKNQSSQVGCNCSGSCTPDKTMGEMYESFLGYLSRSYLKNCVDVKFVDILMDNMESHEVVLKALEQGYTLPLTSINEELKFYGGIDHRQIFNAIRKRDLKH